MDDAYDHDDQEPHVGGSEAAMATDGDSDESDDEDENVGLFGVHTVVYDTQQLQALLREMSDEERKSMQFTVWTVKHNQTEQANEDLRVTGVLSPQVVNSLPADLRGARAKVKHIRAITTYFLVC
jgi:hypothetical protein